MKAFLIDPENREISEVEYDGSLQGIYDLIDADMFEPVGLPNGDAIYVDENGLLTINDHPNPYTKLFWLQHYHTSPLVGKGLVVSVNDEGETVSPSCSLEWLKKEVFFYPS